VRLPLFRRGASKLPEPTPPHGQGRGWVGLPPVQRSVLPVAPVIATEAFEADLASRRRPSVVGELEHALDVHAPAGIVAASAVEDPPAPRPATDALALTVVQQQRAEPAPSGLRQTASRRVVADALVEPARASLVIAANPPQIPVRPLPVVTPDRDVDRMTEVAEPAVEVGPEATFAEVLTSAAAPHDDARSDVAGDRQGHEEVFGAPAPSVIRPAKASTPRPRTSEPQGPKPVVQRDVGPLGSRPRRLGLGPPLRETLRDHPAEQGRDAPGIEPAPPPPTDGAARPPLFVQNANVGRPDIDATSHTLDRRQSPGLVVQRSHSAIRRPSRPADPSDGPAGRPLTAQRAPIASIERTRRATTPTDPPATPKNSDPASTRLAITPTARAGSQRPPASRPLSPLATEPDAHPATGPGRLPRLDVQRLPAGSGQPAALHPGREAVAAGVAVPDAAHGEQQVVFLAGGASSVDAPVIQRQPMDEGPAIQGTAPAMPATAHDEEPPSPEDLDRLAHQLYGRLRARLRSELRLDRERAGLVTDRA